jgi:L-glutamine-phosphate cytidylyltransferase
VKAIIVAAGMGRRLGPYTDDRPKCMVPVAGRPILERQVQALAEHGIRDVIVVRGYLGDRITVPGLRFRDNPRFRENNILASLMYAADELGEDFVFSYSDIVFHPDVVGTLLATAGEAALVVDRQWMRAYEGRTEHPVPEAELARVEDGRITRVGKRAVPADEAAGEFIGLARFSGAVGRLMREEYARLEEQLGAGPFGNAPRFEVAYLTDMLNHLVETHGSELRPAFIDEMWREIDTTQDLDRAERLIRW